MGVKNPADFVSKIRNSIFGPQKYDEVQKVDDVYDKISKKINNDNLANQLELLRKSVSIGMDDAVVDKLAMTMYDNFEYMDRMSRYRNSMEIVDFIPYCNRALRVLSDGILSPDEITKKCLQIVSTTEGTKESTEVNFTRNVVETLGLERILNTEIESTLLFGDSFVEILDYTDNDIPITKTILSEEEYNDDMDYSIEENIQYNFNLMDPRSENGEIIIGETQTSKIKMEITGNKSDFESVLTEENDKKIDLSNLRVIRHDPRTVIKIQSPRYKFCLGYLIFPDVGIVPMSTGPQAVSGLSSTSSSKMNSQYNINGMMNMGASIMSGVDNIYISLLSRMKELLKTDKITVDKKDIESVLNRIIKEIVMDSSNVVASGGRFQVRFVPETRMVHFTINNTRFFPYGESIFYKSTFPAKLLILMETAATIKRLSESTEKRIIYYEAGNNRDSRNVLESIRSQFTKLSYSVDGNATIAQIPSMLNTFQTIYVPQTKGKRYVEFDTLPPNPDIRSLVEDLKFLRDNIVSSLDVPPPFLNIEEGGGSKTSLAFENSIFAETILGYQYKLNPHLKELMNKIYKLIRNESFPSYISIVFPPPRTMQLERESERIDFGSRAIMSLRDIGVPVEYSKKQYLPQIDWDDVDKFTTSQKAKEKLNIDSGPDDSMMGGMGGSGMSSMGGSSTMPY